MSDAMTPFFSIALPAFNAESTLAASIESVLEQEFSDWELIVVDDGSTDGTLDLARGYAKRDRRISVSSQTNAGCGAARDAAASKAHGEFVMKHDADDELLPGALTMLHAFIAEHPGYDIYSANGWKLMPDGSRTPYYTSPRFDRVTSLTLDDMLDECWILGGGAVIRRETLERVGGFRHVRTEDYDLWLRALAAGAAHLYLPERIYLYNYGTPGHMNEDPTLTFRSYIEVFQDLIASGMLTDQQVEHAKRSIRRFESRCEQFARNPVTEARFTTRQAHAFRDAVTRVFGARAAPAVLRLADRVKWVVKPIRIAMARRAQRRCSRDGRA